MCLEVHIERYKGEFSRTIEVAGFPIQPDDHHLHIVLYED